MVGPLPRAVGAAVLVVFSVACLLRGLKGEGADLALLEKLPGLRTFRMK